LSNTRETLENETLVEQLTRTIMTTTITTETSAQRKRASTNRAKARSGRRPRRQSSGSSHRPAAPPPIERKLAPAGGPAILYHDGKRLMMPLTSPSRLWIAAMSHSALALRVVACCVTLLGVLAGHAGNIFWRSGGKPSGPVQFQTGGREFLSARCDLDSDQVQTSNSPPAGLSRQRSMVR